MSTTLIRPTIACLFLATVSLLHAQDASSAVLEDFDNISAWDAKQGGQIEADTTFTQGKGAIKVTFPGMTFKKVTPVKSLKPDSLNDGYEGFSVWVKGDGSDFYGTIVLCGGEHPLWFPYRYAFSFPLKNTDWQKITFPWSAGVPEDPSYPIATVGSMLPSGIQYLKIGSKWSIWWNNKPIPKHSYSIGHVQFEQSVPDDTQKVPLHDIGDVVKKLNDKKPVHILCLGDSITAGTSLSAPDQQRYAAVLQDLLRKKFGYDDITVESHGVGGAQGNDLRLWLDRDIPAGPAPDLITIMYGYNDKTWAESSEYYTYGLNDYLDRIARHTKGASSVLLLPPIPGKGIRYHMMDDFADDVRTVAKARGLTIADVNKAFKDQAGGREGIDKLMADQAHPNPNGHVIIANTIVDALK